MFVSDAPPIVHQGRYGRCTVAHAKDYMKCPDVASRAGRGYFFEFVPKVRQCSAIDPADASPGTWDYTMSLKVHNGRLSGTTRYNNYLPGNEDVADDYGVTFTVTGKFVTSKRMHLVLRGKVTTAGERHADCVGKSFTETHDLVAVSF